MLDDVRRFAQAHRDALFRLRDHLVAHGGPAYTIDFEDDLNSVVKAFDQFAAAAVANLLEQWDEDKTDSVYPDEYWREFGLAHNFVSAQASALTIFAADVQKLAHETNDARLAGLLDRLWEGLARRHQQFFDEPPPYLR